MAELFRAKTALTDLAREGATVKHSHGGGTWAGRAGVHVTFDNGWTVSIQWGNWTYSDNHNADRLEDEARDSTTAEVACWKGAEEMREWAEGDCVAGWQSWDQVQRLLDLAAADAMSDPVELGEGERAHG